MSVEAFRLQNFMPFEDTGWIKLKPICLLFGRNSSGKSAIIRALRLLKQSLVGESRETPFVFVDENGIDLDSFENVVHKREKKRNLSFSFRCTLERNLDVLHAKINEARSRKVLPPIDSQEVRDWVEIQLSYVTGEETSYTWLKKVEITTKLVEGSDTEDSILVLEASFEPDLANYGLEEWLFQSEVFSEYDEDETAFTGAIIETVYGFLPEIIVSNPRLKEESRSQKDLNAVLSILDEITESIKTFLTTFDYLGPVRPKPQRVFALDPIIRLHWEQTGWSAFLEFLDESVDQRLIDFTTEWVRKLDLGIRIDVNSQSLKSATISEVNVRESDSFSVNLVDTGYGASQILPVILECALAEQKAREMLVIIEQPELHLHPRAQAQLADLLIEVSTRGERLLEQRRVSGKPLPTRDELKSLRVRFLIETHSEHLLLRLRRRIAETSAGKLSATEDRDKQLKNEHLGIFFVDRLFTQSVALPVSLTKLGDFAHTPAGFRDFFADDVGEILALSRASREAEELEG